MIEASGFTLLALNLTNHKPIRTLGLLGIGLGVQGRMASPKQERMSRTGSMKTGALLSTLAIDFDYTGMGA